MRHKSFDNYLITSMSLVALASIFMLYGAKLTSFTSTNEIKVASIVEQLKTVKRKRDFYQGWMDVKPGDGLSQNDEIYTHGQSSAKIRFANGPEISLFENSLLRIKTAKTGSTFSLDKGNLIAKLSKDSPNLDIELNGKKYSFNSQNANIQIEQGKTENKFLLLDGKAKLADQEILPNQVVIQNILTGQLQIKEIPFISKLPKNNTTHYYLKQISMNFSWSYTNQVIPLKMTVARDSKFADIIFEETVDTHSKNIDFISPGTYYWKLSSLEKTEGPIKSFTLIEETSPLLTLDQNLIYQGPKSTEKIFLNWSKNDGKRFLLKIENPDGTSKQLELSQNNYEFLPTQLGIYKLAVKVNDLNRPLALWSEPAQLTVNEAQSILITGLTPELIERVNYKKEASNYLLSWNGPATSIEYKIKIIRENKILELETEQNSIPVNLKDFGEYNWEVVGVTPSGITSNKLAGKIIIKAPLQLSQLPSEGAVVELEKPDQLVAFKWDQVPETTTYQFELSDDPAFKNIIVGRDVTSNNISTSLANTGRYYWRVKIKRGDNVEYSSPVGVEVRPSPPLTRPEKSPDIKIKLKYLDEKSSSFNLLDLFFSKAEASEQVAIAEWDLPANTKAKSYIVEIYKDQNLKEMITRIEVEAPHVTWKNALDGVFYWRVSYSDYWGRKTEFSKLSQVFIEAEKKPEVIPPPVEIELLNPKHRAEILKKENEDYIFNWEPIEGKKYYQLAISDNLDFDNLIYKKQVAKNEIIITCKELNNRAGEYYWKVTSGENSSKRRLFEATCAEPVITAPTLKKEAIVEEAPKKFSAHFFRTGLFPHKITYQNKAKLYNAKVDGNVIDSWFLMYQRPLDLKYFQILTPTLWVSRGKVFKTITFTDLELNIKAHRLQSSFSWGPVLGFMKKILYVERSYAITDEALSAPFGGVFIQKDFNNITFGAEVKMGSALNYQANFQYRMKNNVSVGALFDSTSVTKDNNKHTFTRYGLNVNYTFDFLE